MKSSYHCECKFCDAKRDWESEWLPVDVLQAFANVWITFHAFRNHPEVTKDKKRLRYVCGQVFWSGVIIVLYTLLTLLRVICYPLWWLLEKLYY